MIHKKEIRTEIFKAIGERANIDYGKHEIPPPVFLAMKGEILSFDVESAFFRCRFPVLPEQLNPYGCMQGGIVSAAIDNTVGPLSMLVAPPSVTRKMEVKYFIPVEADVDFIYVTARFLEQKKRLLYFEAIVDDEAETTKYATARATHWVL